MIVIPRTDGFYRSEESGVVFTRSPESRFLASLERSDFDPFFDLLFRASVIMTRRMKTQLAALLIALLGSGLQALSASAPRLILVFPLENLSSRPNVGWLSEGIADLIGERLKSPSNYVLSRPERNRAFEQLGFPPDTPLTLASEYKIAETMGVQEAIIGSFKITGQILTTRAQVLNVAQPMGYSFLTTAVAPMIMGLQSWGK